MIGDAKLDSSNMNKLHLIDFGMSQRYLADDGSHLEQQLNVPFKGNIIFAFFSDFFCEQRSLDFKGLSLLI